MMNKCKYLLEALNADAYIDSQWVISILSVVTEDPTREQEKKPYKIIHKNNYYFYLSEDNKTLVQLTETINGNEVPIKTDKPLFFIKEPILISSTEVKNLTTKNIETTVGRLIQNYILLIYPFGNKIEYINKRFTPKNIENIILKRYSLDNPEPEYKDKNLIYFDEYDKFMDACVHMTNFNNISVPALTYKALTPPPEASSRLKELMEQHKGELNNPVVIAEIQKELQKIDKEYIKGDRAEGFLISNKDYDIVRKKMFLMYGDVHGFNENSDISFLAKPLCEGIDYSKLDVYNNDARYGSYSRGIQTVAGGTSVKELLRASSNTSVDEEDCKTTEGLNVFLTEKNVQSYYGLNIITDDGVVKLSDGNVDTFLNKNVRIRMPSHCKTSGNGFCSVCCGDKLSLHPNGLSAAVAEIGNNILYTFMKAMHGKKLATNKVKYKSLIR